MKMLSAWVTISKKGKELSMDKAPVDPCPPDIPDTPELSN